MSLDDKTVRKVAHLTQLAIDENEIPNYGEELSAILYLVDKLSLAETGDVEPMAHPLDAVQRLRPDTADESDRREAFQSQAPAVRGGLYLVPRVIE
jgi:aspartyl-tRNA(Asn)/glutamyl-tRNA(Gln) amidotransferase subunit C